MIARNIFKPIFLLAALIATSGFLLDDGRAQTPHGLISSTGKNVPYYYVNALRHGDGTFSDETIAAAIDSIGGETTTLLLVPGTWIIDDDLTVPSNITLKIVTGAVCETASDKTLTIRGPLEAELYRLFDGPGDVLLRKRVYPEWFGAIAHDDGDDRAAIQAAIDSLPTSETVGNFADDQPGGTVFFTAGVYKIQSPLICTEGVFFQGTSMYATEIYNSNPFSANAIEFINSGRSTAEYFGGISAMCIRGNPSSGHGIYVNKLNYTTFEDLFITGNGGDGIRIHQSVGGTWKHIYSWDNKQWGLQITNDPEQYSTVQMFYACHFRVNLAGGARIYGIACSMHGRCILESNLGVGLHVLGTDNNFRDIYFENNELNEPPDEQVQLLVENYGNLFDGTFIDNGVIQISNTASNNQFVYTRFSKANPNFIIDANCNVNQILFSQPLYPLYLSDGGTGNVILDREELTAGRVNVRGYPTGKLSVYGPSGSEIHHGVSNSHLKITGGSNTSVGGRINLYGEAHATSANVAEYNASQGHKFTGDILPASDGSYYLGEPGLPHRSFKGVILKDESNGKHYKLTVVNGTLTATALD